jgi:DNA-binding transcriptional LysR family regulator
VVGATNPRAKARSLRELADARWVYTSLSGHTGYAKTLFERQGLPPPAPAAVVNSTLGLMSLIAHGDCVGLMPMPIATHPAAAPFMTVVPVQEGPLTLTLGVMVRTESMLKPSVRQFVTHLHRAAGHVGATASVMGLGASP